MSKLKWQRTKKVFYDCRGILFSFPQSSEKLSVVSKHHIVANKSTYIKYQKSWKNPKVTSFGPFFDLMGWGEGIHLVINQTEIFSYNEFPCNFHLYFHSGFQRIVNKIMKSFQKNVFKINKLLSEYGNRPLTLHHLSFETALVCDSDSPKCVLKSLKVCSIIIETPYTYIIM